MLLYKQKLMPFFTPANGSKGVGKGVGISGLTIAASRD